MIMVFLIISIYIAIRLIEREEKQKVPYIKYITNKEKT